MFIKNNFFQTQKFFLFVCAMKNAFKRNNRFDFMTVAAPPVIAAVTPTIVTSVAARNRKSNNSQYATSSSQSSFKASSSIKKQDAPKIPLSLMHDIANTHIFPELNAPATATATTQKVPSEHPSQSLDFLGIVVQPKITEDIDKPNKTLDFGWVIITLDKHTNKSVFSERPDTKTSPAPDARMLNHLVSMHHHRKQLYINMWGMDEYESMFLEKAVEFDDEQMQMQMQQLLQEQSADDAE